MMDGNDLRPRFGHALFPHLMLLFLDIKNLIIRFNAAWNRNRSLFDEISCLIKLYHKRCRPLSRVHCKADRVDELSNILLLTKLWFPVEMNNHTENMLVFDEKQAAKNFCHADEEFFHIFFADWTNFKAAIAFNIPQSCWFTNQMFRALQGANCEALCSSPAKSYHLPCFGFDVSAVSMFRRNNSASCCDFVVHCR